MLAQSLLARVDRDVICHVEDLFQRAAARLRTRLVNRCGSDVPVRFCAVEPGSLGDVFDRIRGQTGAAAAQVLFTPSDLQGFILLEAPLVHRLIGMLLGETPESMGSGRVNRPLSRFDLSLAGIVCEEIVGSLVATVAMTTPVTARVENVVANPRTAQSLPRSTIVVDITLDVGPPDAPFGLCNVVLPVQATGVLWPERDQRRRHEAETEGLGRIMPARVEVVAELARTTLTLGEMRALQPGSTLDLGPVRDVLVRVGDRTAVLGEAGEADGVRSVRVVKLVERGQRPTVAA